MILSANKSIRNWLNSADDHIHPVIQAITLHFVIGYVHPFRDGNGRIARALFYWYLFKCGYTGFRYIAISALLQKSPIKYGQSYLDCEQDKLDLTYFIRYQLSIINRAITEFVSAYERAAYRMAELAEQYSDLDDIEKKLLVLLLVSLVIEKNRQLQPERSKNYWGLVITRLSKDLMTWLLLEYSDVKK